MRLAIVGSRERTDRDRVEAFVAALPGDTVVVTGGAAGIDTFAEDAARARGLAVVVHRPNMVGVRSRGDAIARLLARNQTIVDDCDRVAAFVAATRRGGTEDTIRRARKAGKPVEVIQP
jgi:septum formation inhibitor-activating ATPase MinD